MDETDVRNTNIITRLDRQRIRDRFRISPLSKRLINPAVASIAKGIVTFCRKRRWISKGIYASTKPQMTQKIAPPKALDFERTAAANPTMAGSQNKAKPQPKSQFGAKEVINTNGALPKEGTYNKRRGGTLIVSAAGSGFSDTENKTIGMEVFVNGNRVGTAQVYTNEKLSHKAFVPAFEVVNGVPKGPVKIELKALDGGDTKTDQNDFFRVTVEEQPRG